MTKLISALLSVFVVCHSFSQVNISPNILAEPFQGQHFKVGAVNDDVEGTPFLFDEWKKGQVALRNGEVYQLEKMNLDASRSKFVYTENDTLYEFQDNVTEVKIHSGNSPEDTADMVFRSDLLPNQSGFVQVLAKGRITILRRFNKKPEGENYSNGIVTNTRKYVLHTDDVAVRDNKVIPFKYSSSSLEELTSDKRSQVDSYVKSNNLKPKKENDFLRSINFYNSMHAADN